MFDTGDVGISKVEAVANMLCRINPEIKEDLILEPNGYTDQFLDGYVFLAVDNIELRKKIVQANKFNTEIKAMFDFRTRLTDAQHYAADWSNSKHKEAMLNSMNFSHDEAVEETPMTACGTILGVAPTVRTICSYGVTNFINFIKEGKLKIMILADAFNFDVIAC